MMLIDDAAAQQSLCFHAADATAACEKASKVNRHSAGGVTLQPLRKTLRLLG